MSKTVNTIVWVVLFLLLLPSSLAVASWNSLPGTRLFQVKLVMEQGLVSVTPSAQAKGSLQIAYTSRRFSEAKQLITDKSSTRGLSYLNNQVDVTKQAILRTKDPVVKRQLAQQYVASLRDVSTQLEEQKQIVTSTAPQGRPPDIAYEPPTPTNTPVPTPTPIQEQQVSETPKKIPTREPTPTPFFPPPDYPGSDSDAAVVTSINDSQENIDKAIDEMEKEIDRPGNSDYGHDQGNDNGGNGYGADNQWGD